MTKVKVLIEGYAKQTSSGWLASSTAVLIEDSGKKILVDPGTNKDLLLDRMEEEGLTPKDINFIFLTHYHIDHTFLVALFTDSKLLDGSVIYEKDLETEYSEVIPGT